MLLQRVPRVQRRPVDRLCGREHHWGCSIGVGGRHQLHGKAIVCTNIRFVIMTALSDILCPCFMHAHIKYLFDVTLYTYSHIHIYICI